MTPPGFILFASAGCSLVGLALCVLRWRRGRRDGAPTWRALLSIPRRYLHDVHDVMVRDRRSARMHVASAGGFAASLVLAATVHGLGVTTWPVVALLIVVTSFTVVGAVLDWRRRSTLGDRLSGGLYTLMPDALAAFGIFYLISALPFVGLLAPIEWMSPVGLALFVLGAFGTGFLIAGMMMGPMRHALAGALHLAYHPRSERFSDGQSAADLKLLDLADDKLGVEGASDFTWRQLLSFDACVQCGRCEVVCPAYASGAPLNPKKLIFDLFAASQEIDDQSYAGHHHPDVERRPAFVGEAVALIGANGRLAPETLWACTTCRACVEECPMMIEHVDAIIDMRRFETLERGATPGQGAQVLERLAETDTVSGRVLSSRWDWASKLDLPVARERGHFDVLLWLGEAAFDPRGQRTLQALIEVLRIAQVDFAILGDEELDVGDMARRLGDEALFQSLARRNIEILAKHQFDRIVTNDPHVLHALKNEYSALGGHYVVVHHTTLAAQLLKQGRLSPVAAHADRVTYHDPCYLGRYNKEFLAPRALLDALGLERVEMERSGTRSFCCGWGGGAVVTDVPSRTRIADLRMAEAAATGAKIVAAACPNCAVMLEGSAGPRLEVVDVIELLAAAVKPSPTRSATS